MKYTPRVAKPGQRSEERVAFVLEYLQDCDPSEYHWILNEAAQRRPWRPIRKGWEDLLDQVLHMLYIVVMLFPLIWLNSWIGAALTGFIAGSIREIEQYFHQDLRIRMISDRVKDIFFFVLGALLIYGLCSIIK